MTRSADFDKLQRVCIRVPAEQRRASRLARGVLHACSIEPAFQRCHVSYRQCKVADFIRAGGIMTLLFILVMMLMLGLFYG